MWMDMDFLTDQGVFSVGGVLTLKCWSSAVLHGHSGDVVPVVLNQDEDFVGLI